MRFLHSPARTGVGLRAWLRTRASRVPLGIPVFAGGCLAFGVLFWSSLRNPPFWDSAWTVAAGAAELNRTGMDLVDLIQRPEFYEGGPGTHSTSILTVLWAVILAIFGPETWLPVIHLVNILMAAGLVASTHALAIRFVSRTLALFVAAATVTIPLILQQVADPYLDLPLALLTTLAVKSAIGREWRATVLLAMAATALKPSGLILLSLIPLSTNRGRRIVIGMGVAALPIAPFLIRELGFASRPELAEGGWALLWLSLLNLGMVPEVALILGAGMLGAVQLRKEGQALGAPVLAIFLAHFGLYAFTIGVTRSVVLLPRYLVMVLPIAVLVTAVSLHRKSRLSAHIAIAGLFVFSMFNLFGRAHPVPDHPNPISAERSLGAHEYLALQRATTGRLAGVTAEAIVADGHMWFRLEYPELGYVDRTPPQLVSLSQLEDRLPRSIAWAVEPHNKSMDAYLTALADRNGYDVERITIYDGRWTSQLVFASR